MDQITLQSRQRLLFRCVAEFLLDEAAALARRHDGDLVKGSVLLAVAQATRPRDESGLARSVSGRAIARSLSLPVETTRRKLAELATSGHCQKVGVGYAVTTSYLSSPERRAEARSAVGGIGKVVTALAALGVDVAALPIAPGPPPAVDHRASPLEIAACVTDDFLLRAYETSSYAQGSPVDSAVNAAMLSINAEAVTHDPELAWRYASSAEAPPADLRRPATLRAMSDRTGLSYETVQRMVRRAVRLGRCERQRGGYLCKAEWLQAPEMLQSGLHLSQRFVQVVKALDQLALDPVALTA